MKVLVTGGFGMVGSAVQDIVDKMLNPNEFIFLSRQDGDLRNKEEVEHIFGEHNPDTVVHLGSYVAGLYGNKMNNYTMLMDNLKIHANVIESCKKFQVKKLINILSTCVFPDKGVVYPLTSDQILRGEPHESNSGYAYSKRFLFIGSELLSKETGMQVINLTPTNLYGFHDNYHLVKAHVIPALIHKCYLAKINSTNLHIKGDGNSRRQFVYASDFASIILNSIDLDGSANMVISPSTSDEITIKNLVELITKELEFQGEVIYDTEFSNGQVLKTSDSKEVLEHFPDFEFTMLESGLSDTIRYFVQNYETIRK